MLITGASGLGKSWLACALGQKACRQDISVLYYRVPRLFTDLAIAHGDGRYARLLRTISRAKLLILDDWGPETLTPDQARDLLEIVEDRYDAGSVMIKMCIRDRLNAVGSVDGASMIEPLAA